MKLQQLRYFRAVARNGLRISAAARELHTSQPGVSKQIIALEQELGLPLFQRRGRQLTALTEAGSRILTMAEDVLHQTAAIRSLADEYSDPSRGSLGIATTHTQSRYVLPPVIQQFIQQYPDVALQLHQGTPEQIAAMAANGTADFAIATEAISQTGDLLMLPCYHWNRVILVPEEHHLWQRYSGKETLTLEALAEEPLVTYVFGFTGRSQLDEAFVSRGLKPRVVFTAADADVIKTYVRLGMGVGIVAAMAHDPVTDPELRAIDASHLFANSLTRIGFRRGTQLRRYMVDFITMFAPHLERDLLEQLARCQYQEEVDALCQGIIVPVHGQ